jgi:hypothetical protein
MSFTPLSQPPQTNPAKYKTMLCKHFSSTKGCSFGDKCQFAHGISELRSTNGMMNPMMGIPEKKKGPNPQNYKIVKCKYWEKDGTCRYGTLCTFAHGEQELRTKSDNIAYAQNEQINNQMYPMMQNPFLIGFDPNVMNNMNMINYPDPNIMNNMFLGMNNVNNMNVNPNLGMNLIGNQIEEKKEEKESMDN